MPTLAQERQMRNVLAEKITSGDPVLQKEAAASLDKFIRKSFKEQSFFDKIIEPQQLTTDDFYKHMTSDKLWVMLEIEPQCPGVVTMAYNTPAPIMTFGAKRTLTSIDRIKSVRMKKEVNELITWSVSLRDIQADFQLKEVLTKFDTRGMACINACVGTRPNTVMKATGSVHYHRVYDGLTHNALAQVEYSADDIANAMILPVRIFNETPPRLSRFQFTLMNFPYYEYWVLGTAAELLRISVLHYTRNKLLSSHGGLQGDEKARDREYMQLAQLYQEEYRQWVKVKKHELNYSGGQGWGTLHSDYVFYQNWR